MHSSRSQIHTSSSNEISTVNKVHVQYKRKETKMVFIIFVALAFISLIVSLIMKNKAVAAASGVVLLITITIPVGVYMGNIGKMADLEAFYSASATNFQISRDDTASYLSEDKISAGTLIAITGSIERMGIGAATANRVLDYRNAVNIYNSSYLRFKAYSNNILVGIAYPKPPSEMRLLIINPVQNGSPNNYKTPTTTTTEPIPGIPVQTPVVPNSLDQQIQDAINKALGK